MAKLKQEYVSFEETNIIKGILMLLVIAGHCHYLIPIDSLPFRYLYHFHVFCFFILPFFYDKRNNFTFSKIKNTIIKCYVPYFFFFVLCTIIYLMVDKSWGDYNGGKSVLAFFIGNDQLLKTQTGFYYLWFLPTFCSFTIIKYFFENRYNKDDKNKFIAFTLAMLIVITFFILPEKKVLFISSVVPFAITRALYLFSCGFVTYLLAKIPYGKYVGGIVFVVLSFLYLLNNGKIIVPIYLFPATAFLFLLSIKGIVMQILNIHHLQLFGKFLQLLGKLSFPIYLVHVIIYNVLEKLFNHTILNSIITFLLTILLSIVVAMLMNRILLIQKLVLPKGYDDFKSLFVKSVS